MRQMGSGAGGSFKWERLILGQNLDSGYGLRLHTPDDDAYRWSTYQTIWYFIWNKTDALHFFKVKYSLQQSGKTILH